ncbi:MAG: hypothetical protein ACYDEV_17330 [Acidiferrobacter sp.]
MDPVEFLKAATSWESSALEAERRSAVSRAYYACFHAAKHYLQAHGVPYLTSGGSHERVINALNDAGDASVKITARKLLRLKAKRHVADYKLNNPFGAYETHLSVALAKRIFPALK